MAGEGCCASLTERQTRGWGDHAIPQRGGEHDAAPSTAAERLDRAVETAVERAIFGGNELARRRFIQIVGAGTAAAIIRSAFPLEMAKALAQENVKSVEKKDL